MPSLLGWWMSCWLLSAGPVAAQTTSPASAAPAAPSPHSELQQTSPSEPQQPLTPESEALVEPKPIGGLPVEYPASAKGNAEVELELVIGYDGAVEETLVIRGEEPFASAARESAQGWHFEPAKRAGQPLRVRIRLQVRYTEPEPPASISPVPRAGASPVPGAAPPPATAAPGVSTQASSSRELSGSSKIEVVVSGERTEDRQRLSRAEVRQLPGAFGDPFRAIEALPGVTPIATGLPYFYVRGSPAGNVGYYLDGIVVPTLYHAVIGPSVVHPAFIETVSLYPGAYPARYGRFAGGIVAGETAAPEYRFRGEASLRLVDAGALFELPLANDRLSVMVGGRYSYTALLLSLLFPQVEVGYWDYQGRVVYRVSDRDTLTLFAFGARDFLRDEEEARTIFDQVFHRLELRYDRILSPRSALRLAATTGLDQTLANEDEGFQLDARNLAFRIEHSLRFDPKTRLRSGADVAYRDFDVRLDPNFGPDLAGGGDESTEEFDANDFRRLFPTRDEVVSGIHSELGLGVSERLTLTPGFRFDIYHSQGLTFFAPEPRLSVRYAISDDLALLYDIGLAHQAPSVAVPLAGFAPRFQGGLQRSLQNSGGVELGLPFELTLSTTLFYNLLFNGTDALSVSRIDNGDPNIDNNLDRVSGRAYGLELYFRRPLTERLGGFISYTLSRAERSIGGLQGPSAFDRTHVLNLALAYELGAGWRFGSRFSGYSGIPADVAIAEAARRPPRTPFFYRLDWRLEKRWLVGTSGAWMAFVLEVLNTTLSREVISSSCYAYGCREDRVGPVTIPSLGVEATF